MVNNIMEKNSAGNVNGKSQGWADTGHGRPR